MVKMITAAVQFELLWGVAGDSGQLITELRNKKGVDLLLISPVNLNLNRALIPWSQSVAPSVAPL